MPTIRRDAGFYPGLCTCSFIGLIRCVRIVPAEMRGGYSLENVRIHAHFAAMHNSAAFGAKPTFSGLRLQYGL
jgi:hypothetical protein